MFHSNFSRLFHGEGIKFPESLDLTLSSLSVIYYFFWRGKRGRAEKKTGFIIISFSSLLLLFLSTFSFSLRAPAHPENVDIEYIFEHDVVTSFSSIRLHTLRRFLADFPEETNYFTQNALVISRRFPPDPSFSLLLEILILPTQVKYIGGTT